MAKAIKTVNLIVSAIDEPAPGIKRFVLQDEDHWPLPPCLPGAHIDVHLPGGLVRTYSLCNEPQDNHRYVIAVKHEVAGRGGSRAMHEELKPGTHVGVSLPRGGIRVSDVAPNIFVAGGIGITPFISAIRDMERRGQSNYELHWSSAGQPSLMEMLSSAAAAGRVKLYNTLVDPPPDLQTIANSHGPEARAYCCGPAGMLDAFEQAVDAWSEDRKHVERFTPPKLPVSLTSVPFTVILAKSRKEAVVLPERGLMRTLEDLEAEVSFSCEGGICGACRTPWLEGPPTHRDRVLTPEERNHEVIVCVAECAGSRLVLDI